MILNASDARVQFHPTLFAVARNSFVLLTVPQTCVQINATDTSAVLQTQVLYHRHVYNATDTSDVLRHYSGCSSRSKGLICTCDGGAVSVCLGLSQPLPKDHLALSMLNICVQLALSFISSPIISPQPALSQSVDHIRMFYRFPHQTCA